MRVLITGAAGFIGRHAAAKASLLGWQALGVDSFITSQRKDIERDREDWNGHEFHELDIRDALFVELGSKFEPEVIFHLACPTGVPNLGPLADEMIETSFDGTRHVLEIARRCGSRVVFASSAEVYGDPLESPQREEYTGNVDTLGPRKAYEEGKRVGETLCGIAAERRGIQVAIARIFNTYGSGMNVDDTRVIPAFVKAAIEGKPLVIHGAGEQTRCHCYVSDTLDGLWRIALSAPAGAVYNVGSSVQHSIRELAEHVIALSESNSAITSIERPAHDHQDRLPATERIRNELGWSPRVGLDEGLLRTIADFRTRLGLPVNAVVGRA